MICRRQRSKTRKSKKAGDRAEEHRTGSGAESLSKFPDSQLLRSFAKKYPRRDKPQDNNDVDLNCAICWQESRGGAQESDSNTSAHHVCAVSPTTIPCLDWHFHLRPMNELPIQVRRHLHGLSRRLLLGIRRKMIPRLRSQQILYLRRGAKILQNPRRVLHFP